MSERGDLRFKERLLIGIDEVSLKNDLLRRVGAFIDGMIDDGVYVWGTGRLGKFAAEQLQLNRIKFKGFISNSDLPYFINRLSNASSGDKHNSEEKSQSLRSCRHDFHSDNSAHIPF